MNARTYHHKDLKAALIEQGLKLLDAEGYDGFSLRKVAALCGVSQTAPYRHFKNKDALIGAITGQALDAFGRRLQAAVDRHPNDPKAQLTEMGIAYIRFFCENPEYLRLLFLSDTQLKLQFSKCEAAKEHVPAFRVLTDTISRFIDAYPDNPYSRDELIIYSWGLVHGIATLIAADELPGGEDGLRSAEKVLRGIFQMV